jgi:membrane-associated phospholipid phosphatase
MNRILASMVLLASLAALSMAADPATEPGQIVTPVSPAATPPQESAPASISEPPDSDSKPPATADRPVSWKLLLPNVVHDQQHIWTFPVRLAHGQNLVPTIAVLGTMTGLGAADPGESAYFRRTTAFHGFNRVFSGGATALGTFAAPVFLYAAGLVRKDSKMKGTALLAGEAVADSEILSTVLKSATGRMRPSSVPLKGNFSDTWFEKGFTFGSASFPSGHTITAFSVATVIARRYGNHRWVPYAAYGAAALVGFSRLSLSAHFLTDVFMGGALGYSIGRFTVLRQ